MVDETGYGEGPPKLKQGIRSAVMNSLEAGKWLWTTKFGGNKSGSPVHRLSMLGWYLRYGMKWGMCARRKRKPVKIDEMIAAWIEAIVGMCQAHDKDEYDAHDAKADELLGPLLTA